MELNYIISGLSSLFIDCICGMACISVIIGIIDICYQIVSYESEDDSNE